MNPLQYDDTKAFTVLTLIFIVLKLTHYISWSWWWVLSPILLAFVAEILLAIIIIIIIIVFLKGK